MKTCSTCKEIKPLECFSKNRQSRDGLQGHCKSCSTIIARNWAIKNPEKARERSRLWAENNRQTGKNWRKNNPEKAKSISKKSHTKWYEQNKDKAVEKARKWKLNNRDKTCALNAKRKALKLKATPPWIDKMLLAQIKWYYAAARMMTETSGIPHHVDHIHPLQGDGVCGLHVPWNLRVIPASENIKKYNKLES
jgi:hypothetical protein